MQNVSWLLQNENYWLIVAPVTFWCEPTADSIVVSPSICVPTLVATSGNCSCDVTVLMTPIEKRRPQSLPFQRPTSPQSGHQHRFWSVLHVIGILSRACSSMEHWTSDEVGGNPPPLDVNQNDTAEVHVHRVPAVFESLASPTTQDGLCC